MDIQRPATVRRVGGRRGAERVTVADDDNRRRTVLVDEATAIDVFGDARFAGRHTRHPSLQTGALLVGSRSYPIYEGANKIGSSGDCHIIINHPSISSIHAIIHSESRTTWVCDIDSSNGTTVRGTKLPSPSNHVIINGDFIMFGIVNTMFTTAIENF